MKLAAILLASLALGSEDPSRTLEWSGRTWEVKSSDGESVGPGPNIFTDSRKAVFVDDDGALHLTIRKRRSHWQSTEIVLPESLGYGSYRFDIAPGATGIADNAVFGLFTYDLQPGENYREVDIELSRWGDGRRDNLQCSVQPADAPDLYSRFPLPDNGQGWIMEFTWAPGLFECRVLAKDGAIVGTGRVTRDVPTPGDEKTRLNLWQFRGQPPTNNVASEVVVRSFTFVPRSD